MIENQPRPGTELHSPMFVLQMRWWRQDWTAEKRVAAVTKLRDACAATIAECDRYIELRRR